MQERLQIQIRFIAHAVAATKIQLSRPVRLVVKVAFGIIFPRNIRTMRRASDPGIESGLIEKDEEKKDDEMWSMRKAASKQRTR